MKTSRKDSKGRVLRKGETVRSNGMYQYAYTDVYGKRQYIYAKDLVVLRQKEEEITKDQWDGIDSRTAKNQTLNDLFDKYMATRKDLSPRTYAGYLYQYNAYVRPTFGRRKIKDIKYSDVLYFYKNLMEERNLSYGTIEHLQRELHPAFEMAVRDCIIRNNPTSKVLGQFKRQTGAKSGVRKALTPEQEITFLNFLKNHPVYGHWRPIFLFLLGTGLRVGELSALRWCDIDLEDGSVDVNHALVYFAGKLNPTDKRLYISTTKTDAGIRTIYTSNCEVVHQKYINHK